MMKQHTYYSILGEYNKLRAKYAIFEMRQILDALISKFVKVKERHGRDRRNEDDNEWQISGGAIYSLISYEFQRETKTIMYRDWKAFAQDNYYAFINGETNLIILSNRHQISPALLAHRMLLHHNNYEKAKTKQQLADTCSIPNGRLAYEVMLCQLNDIMYGPHATQLSHYSGINFEAQIESLLKTKGVSHLTEKDLRSHAFYDVTPDFKLHLPLVLTRSKTYSGKHNEIKLYKVNLDQDNDDYIESEKVSDCQTQIITWIECKSLFASGECHEDYLNNQYLSYVNRFSDGIVIYNYGFIDSIRQVPSIFVTHALPNLC